MTAPGLWFDGSGMQIRLRGLLILALAASAGAVIGSCGNPANSDVQVKAGQSTATERDAHLAAIASSEASENLAPGAELPAKAEVVHVTRSVFSQAIHESWSKSEVDSPVAVIQMRGRFIAYASSPPRRFDLPKGAVLEVAVNEATGEITDFGVSDLPIDMAHLGAVQTLDVRKPGSESGHATEPGNR